MAMTALCPGASIMRPAGFVAKPTPYPTRCELLGHEDKQGLEHLLGALGLADGVAGPAQIVDPLGWHGDARRVSR